MYVYDSDGLIVVITWFMALQVVKVEAFIGFRVRVSDGGSEGTSSTCEIIREYIL